MNETNDPIKLLLTADTHISSKLELITTIWIFRKIITFFTALIECV